MNNLLKLFIIAILIVISAEGGYLLRAEVTRSNSQQNKPIGVASDQCAKIETSQVPAAYIHPNINSLFEGIPFSSLWFSELHIIVPAVFKSRSGNTFIVQIEGGREKSFQIPDSDSIEYRITDADSTSSKSASEKDINSGDKIHISVWMNTLKGRVNQVSISKVVPKDALSSNLQMNLLKK